MSGYHAKLSPSSSKQWKLCTAAPGAQAGLPNPGSDASRWGSANHLVSSTCLELARDPSFYKGYTVYFTEERAEHLLPPGEVIVGALFAVEIDDAQVACSTSYVTFVRDRAAATGGTLLIEQKLPIGHITGELDATGTGDAVLMIPSQREIEVADLKGGMGRVNAWEPTADPEVFDPNSQLAMYGLGALAENDPFGELYDTVRLTIVQPRLGHTSEHVISVADLHTYGATLSRAAEETRVNPQFVPGDEQCFFCRAKPTCEAHQAYVLEGMPDLEAITKTTDVKLYPVSTIFLKRGLIRKFLDAVEDHAHAEFTAGRQVDGLKQIDGKLGARQWISPDHAEQTLRHSMRLKEEDAYNRTLISPADAEKLAESGVIGKRQWKTLQEKHIEQRKSKPQIVSSNDPRPAIPGAVDDMPNLDEVDLFA